MAAKGFHGADKSALTQQAAGTRRGAPGKKFIGETSDQSGAARSATRKRVERMAEIDAAERRAEELGEPISAILAELVTDALRLTRTIVSAPFRVAAAIRRRPRPA